MLVLVSHGLFWVRHQAFITNIDNIALSNNKDFFNIYSMKQKVLFSFWQVGQM